VPGLLFDARITNLSPAVTTEQVFPDFIRELPEPDSPLAGLRARMLQSARAMAMFYELPDGVAVPEHAHGAQWGVVLEGRVDFTIGGETQTFERGDTFSIPDGVPHSAVIHPGYVGIDVFADADRYRPKPGT
jgi:quercetin dioxygenase-like cupin family protein